MAEDGVEASPSNKANSSLRSWSRLSRLVVVRIQCRWQPGFSSSAIEEMEREGARVLMCINHHVDAISSTVHQPQPCFAAVILGHRGYSVLS
jgi:hypothetical protein